jgi:oxaloacetate decarboxylase (Na+ extruding) subunit alpha
VTERPVGRRPGGLDGEAAIDLDGLTSEIVPALIARLRASRLAELEVRSDGWRVRLRRDLRTPRRSARGHAGDGHPGTELEGDPAGAARSPAVGYFSPVRGLVVGQVVAAGDSLGSVDVLGIAQEVTAPLGGVVSAVLAEAGQAVEYGQVLAEIDPLADEQPLGSSDDADDEGLVADADLSEVRS